MSLIGSIFLFIGGVALLGYIPGALILSIARLDVSRLERFILSLTLGLAWQSGQRTFERTAGTAAVLS